MFQLLTIKSLILPISDNGNRIRRHQFKPFWRHYQTHYEVLNDSVARLERSRTGASVVFEEVAMYIDKEGYLIIRPFTTGSPLSLEYPNYAWLKLRKK